jgi:hypothetical protein
LPTENTSSEKNTDIFAISGLPDVQEAGPALENILDHLTLKSRLDKLISPTKPRRVSSRAAAGFADGK